MAAGSDPTLQVWLNEADFRSGKAPVMSTEITFNQYGGHVLADDLLLPDGAFIAIDAQSTYDFRAEDGISAVVGYSTTTTEHRLAPWHLDPALAKEGDVLVFDGVHWVAATLPQPQQVEEYRLLPPYTPEDGQVLMASSGYPIWMYPNFQPHVMDGPSDLELRSFEIVDDGENPPRLRYKSSSGTVYTLPMVAE